MNNLTVTVLDPKVKSLNHYKSFNECKVLIGVVSGKEEIYYIAEESEVNHECIGTPKRMLYDRLKRSSGGINIEISRIADKVLDMNGERKEVAYKVIRLV